MKITKKKLENIIKEELAKILQEQKASWSDLSRNTQMRAVPDRQDFEELINSLEAFAKMYADMGAIQKQAFKDAARYAREHMRKLGRESDVAPPPAGSGAPVNMKVTGGTSP